MMKSSVYVALVEVVPLGGCQLAPSDYGGAAVRCYVASDSEEDAVERIARTLRGCRFEVVAVEWCVGEAAVAWDRPNDATAAALISEARACKAVVFGEFHTWPPE